MKLSQLNTLNGEVSANASTQARTLALAGLALVWLFAGPFFLQSPQASRPSRLLFAAGGLLALSLALDLVQLYARAGLLNSAFTRAQSELQADLAAGRDPDVGSLGRRIQTVTVVLFYVKAVPLGIGYLLVLLFFVIQL